MSRKQTCPQNLKKIAIETVMLNHHHRGVTSHKQFHNQHHYHCHERKYQTDQIKSN